MDHQGFLRDIIEHPDDDTPRLVYSDWLEEHGKETDRARAEFIRLQVELARQTQDSPRRREQAYRARELLDQYRDRWLKPLHRLRLRDVHFARGFVEKVALTGAALQKHAADMFGSLPVRRLWVTKLSGRASRSLGLIPANSKLSGLNLCGNTIDARALKDLAQLTNLGELRVLGLLFAGIDDKAAGLLCELPFFQRLSLIRCGGNPLSEDARQRLRDHFGERVSFVVARDEDHLYSIPNDDFTAGFGHDYTQILLYSTQTEIQLVLFDHEGNLLGTARRSLVQPEKPAGPWQDLPMETRKAWLSRRDAIRQEAREAWLKELGYQPATIRVKEFRFDDNRGIHGFPGGWTETLSTPDDPEWETARGWLDDWLAEGSFAYVFGPGCDWWLNAQGEVTDT
ncbi:MAG: TIGR02996 domain-containing protein [Planctomycetes bacterium]|nr:TIGR02996 domain-containing protein [Planctomycetota bacterium]